MGGSTDETRECLRVPTFPTTEYRNRLGRTKARLRTRELDALVVVDPANIKYLVGYDAWSFHAEQFLVVVEDASDPIWLGDPMELETARRTTWLSDEDVRTYGSEYTKPYEDRDHFVPANDRRVNALVTVLSDADCEAGTIGVESESFYLRPRSYETLQRELPGATVQDASQFVRGLRVVKSDREIDYMRQAGALSDRGIQAGIAAIERGTRESAVAAAILEALIGGTERFGGDYPSIVPLLSSGADAELPHLTWSDRRIEAGEVVTMEISGCKHRYHAPVSRTVCVGSPAERTESMARTAIRGLSAVIETIEPGVTAGELHTAWRTAMPESGLQKKGPLGYSVGLSYPPDYAEGIGFIRKGDPFELTPNMVFHLVPFIRSDGLGIEFSETVRVTDTGSERLTTHPLELTVV